MLWSKKISHSFFDNLKFFMNSRVSRNIIGGVVLVGAGVYGYNCFNVVPFTNRKQFLAYPLFLDKIIGRWLVGKYETHQQMLPNEHESYKRVGRVLKKLKNIDELKDYRKFDFKLILMDIYIENFLSIPGGAIVVFLPYINSVKDYTNDATLASMLAHEMGHIVARHQCEGSGRVYGINTLVVCSLIVAYKYPGIAVIRGYKFPGVLGLLSLVGASILKYVDFKTRYIAKQQKELEADYMSMYIMACAGYDPGFAISMMEKQCQRTDSTSHFPSHPPSKERLDMMKGIYPKMFAIYKEKGDPEASLQPTGSAP